MIQKEFDSVVEQVVKHVQSVLTAKGIEYQSPNGDRLGQFKNAARILNCTPAQALLSFAGKHLTTLMGWIQADYLPTPEQANEKIGDLRGIAA